MDKSAIATDKYCFYDYHVHYVLWKNFHNHLNKQLNVFDNPHGGGFEYGFAALHHCNIRIIELFEIHIHTLCGSEEIFSLPLNHNHMDKQIRLKNNEISNGLL
jgi:hypothetical protein